MKKLTAMILLVSLLSAPVIFAEDAMKSMPMSEKGGNAMKRMYQCPMDGTLSEKPGKCPKCGMDLVEKK